MILQRFVSDRRGNVRVGVVVMLMICLTFITWLVTWTPVSMMIDILKTMTANEQALQILNYTHFGAGIVLLGEVAALLIWLFASAFQREDQTYAYGGYEY